MSDTNPRMARPSRAILFSRGPQRFLPVDKDYHTTGLPEDAPSDPSAEEQPSHRSAEE